MKNSIGSSLLLYIVLILIGVIGSIYIANNNYSKAYRAKNSIISIINNDYMVNHGDKTIGLTKQYYTDCFNDSLNFPTYRSSCVSRISDTLNKMGYYMKVEEKSVCNKIMENKGYSELTYPKAMDEFEGYCIFKKNVSSKSYYYIIVTFNHMNIKAFNLGSLYKSPVYGQTRVYNIK